MTTYAMTCPCQQEVEEVEARLWEEAMAAARERAQQDRRRYRQQQEVPPAAPMGYGCSGHAWQRLSGNHHLICPYQRRIFPKPMEWVHWQHEEGVHGAYRVDQGAFF